MEQIIPRLRGLIQCTFVISHFLRVKNLNVIDSGLLTRLQSRCWPCLPSYQSSIWGGCDPKLIHCRLVSDLHQLLARDIRTLPDGPLDNSAHMSIDFLQSKQVGELLRGPSQKLEYICNLISEVLINLQLHFIRNELICPVYVQEEKITQGCEYQEAGIIGDHF